VLVESPRCPKALVANDVSKQQQSRTPDNLHMGRPLRMHLPEDVYFVTNRTIEERFWLTPYDEAKKIFGRWLARAVKKFGIELYAHCVMGNHYHLLLRAPNDNLSAFMEFLQANVAKAINRLHDRRGPLWQRRYSAEPVLDVEAMVDRMGYILANPTSAHLVLVPEQWPGLTSMGVIVGQPPECFTYFDATAWYRAGRPKDKGPFHHTVELTVMRLPELAHLDDEAYRQRVLDAVSVYTDAAAAEQRRRGIRVMGLVKLRRVNPSSRPHQPKRSNRPLCHTTMRSLWVTFKQMTRSFEGRYRKAAAQYRQGVVDVVFPPGSFPPSRWPAACTTSL